jgi:NADPH2:quinone reductase
VRVLEIRTLDGPAGMAVAEYPDPSGDDVVVIEVRAAGVSFPDLLLSRGGYQTKPRLPWVPGAEVAGIVRSAPPGHRLSPGQRAWAYVDRGGFAEVTAAHPLRAFPLPDALTFEQGAALGVNYLTATFALGLRGHLQPHETLLVLGAGGGLGTALIGVGKARAARVLAVTSTDAKAQAARAAGADETIVGADWRDEALALTDQRGVDVVADVVGGDATLQAVRTTAPKGRVLVLGFSSGSIGSVPANRLLLRNASLVGVGLGAYLEREPGSIGALADEVARYVEAGLRPLVGRTFPLADGAQALRALEAREAVGKLVLLPGS